MHSTLLSKPQPVMISAAQSGKTAVSSTTMGGLPGPAAMVLQALPAVMATFTMAGPPVTIFMLVPGWQSGCLVASWVGLAIVVTRLAGPPAATMAELSVRTASATQPLAAGCGEKTAALPAASMPMALLIMVATGLVDGVMAATTPKGAYSTRARPLSPV